MINFFATSNVTSLILTLPLCLNATIQHQSRSFAVGGRKTPSGGGRRHSKLSIKQLDLNYTAIPRFPGKKGRMLAVQEKQLQLQKEISKQSLASEDASVNGEILDMQRNLMSMNSMTGSRPFYIHHRRLLLPQRKRVAPQVEVDAMLVINSLRKEEDERGYVGRESDSATTTWEDGAGMAKSYWMEIDTSFADTLDINVAMPLTLDAPGGAGVQVSSDIQKKITREEKKIKKFVEAQPSSYLEAKGINDKYYQYLLTSPQATAIEIAAILINHANIYLKFEIVNDEGRHIEQQFYSLELNSGPTYQLKDLKTNPRRSYFTLLELYDLCHQRLWSLVEQDVQLCINIAHVNVLATPEHTHFLAPQKNQIISVDLLYSLISALRAVSLNSITNRADWEDNYPAYYYTEGVFMHGTLVTRGMKALASLVRNQFIDYLRYVEACRMYQIGKRKKVLQQEIKNKQALLGSKRQNEKGQLECDDDRRKKISLNGDEKQLEQKDNSESSHEPTPPPAPFFGAYLNISGDTVSDYLVFLNYSINDDGVRFTLQNDSSLTSSSSTHEYSLEQILCAPCDLTSDTGKKMLYPHRLTADIRELYSRSRYCEDQSLYSFKTPAEYIDRIVQCCTICTNYGEQLFPEGKGVEVGGQGAPLFFSERDTKLSCQRMLLKLLCSKRIYPFLTKDIVLNFAQIVCENLVDSSKSASKEGSIDAESLIHVFLVDSFATATESQQKKEQHQQSFELNFHGAQRQVWLLANILTPYSYAAFNGDLIIAKEQKKNEEDDNSSHHLNHSFSSLFVKDESYQYVLERYFRALALSGGGNSTSLTLDNDDIHISSKGEKHFPGVNPLQSSHYDTRGHLKKDLSHSSVHSKNLSIDRNRGGGGASTQRVLTAIPLENYTPKDVVMYITLCTAVVLGLMREKPCLLQQSASSLSASSFLLTRPRRQKETNGMQRTVPSFAFDPKPYLQFAVLYCRELVRSAGKNQASIPFVCSGFAHEANMTGGTDALHDRSLVTKDHGMKPLMELFGLDLDGEGECSGDLDVKRLNEMYSNRLRHHKDIHQNMKLHMQLGEEGYEPVRLNNNDVATLFTALNGATQLWNAYVSLNSQLRAYKEAIAAAIRDQKQEISTSISDESQRCKNDFKKTLGQNHSYQVVGSVNAELAAEELLQVLEARTSSGYNTESVVDFRARLDALITVVREMNLRVEQFAGADRGGASRSFPLDHQNLKGMREHRESMIQEKLDRERRYSLALGKLRKQLSILDHELQIILKQDTFADYKWFRDHNKTSVNTNDIINDNGVCLNLEPVQGRFPMYYSHLLSIVLLLELFAACRYDLAHLCALEHQVVKYVGVVGQCIALVPMKNRPSEISRLIALIKRSAVALATLYNLHVEDAILLSAGQRSFDTYSLLANTLVQLLNTQRSSDALSSQNACDAIKFLGVAFQSTLDSIEEVNSEQRAGCSAAIAVALNIAAKVHEVVPFHDLFPPESLPSTSCIEYGHVLASWLCCLENTSQINEGSFYEPPCTIIPAEQKEYKISTSSVLNNATEITDGVTHFCIKCASRAALYLCHGITQGAGMGTLQWEHVLAFVSSVSTLRGYWNIIMQDHTHRNTTMKEKNECENNAPFIPSQSLLSLGSMFANAFGFVASTMFMMSENLGAYPPLAHLLEDTTTIDLLPLRQSEAVLFTLLGLAAFPVNGGNGASKESQCVPRGGARGIVGFGVITNCFIIGIRRTLSTTIKRWRVSLLASGNRPGAALDDHMLMNSADDLVSVTEMNLTLLTSLRGVPAVQPGGVGDVAAGALKKLESALVNAIVMAIVVADATVSAGDGGPLNGEVVSNALAHAAEVLHACGVWERAQRIYEHYAGGEKKTTFF